MRAHLLRLLRGPLPAFVVAALVFAGLHPANPGAAALAGATVAVAGLLFYALYALTGRLWVPIVCTSPGTSPRDTSSAPQSPATTSAARSPSAPPTQARRRG